jgi:hypothetical protein
MPDSYQEDYHIEKAERPQTAERRACLNYERQTRTSGNSGDRARADRC